MATGFCTKCGAALGDNKFCTSCGAPVEQQTAPVEAQPVSAPVATNYTPAPAPTPAPAFTPTPAPAPAPAPVSYAAAPAPAPVAAAAPDADGKPPKGSKYEVMTVGRWIGTLFISIIPLVGFIFFLIWLFGGGKNVNRTNYVRASLIFGLIISVLVIILLIVFGALLAPVITGFIESLKQQHGDVAGGAGIQDILNGITTGM